MGKRNVRQHLRRNPDGSVSTVRQHARESATGVGAADAATASSAAAAAEASSSEVPDYEHAEFKDLREGDILKVGLLPCEPLPLEGWAVVTRVEEDSGGKIRISLSGRHADQGAPAVAEGAFASAGRCVRKRRPNDPTKWVSDCASCEAESSSETAEDGGPLPDISLEEPADMVSEGRLCPMCMNSMALMHIGALRGDAAAESIVSDNPWLDNGYDRRAAEPDTPRPVPQPRMTGTWAGAPLAAIPLKDLRTGSVVADRSNGGFAVVTSARIDDEGRIHVDVCGWLGDNLNGCVSRAVLSGLPDEEHSFAVKRPPYDTEPYVGWEAASCQRCRTPVRSQTPISSVGNAFNMLRYGGLCAYCVHTVAEGIVKEHIRDISDIDVGTRS